MFERLVEQYPDRLAVKSGRDSLTYAELNRAANRVAHALLVRSGAASEPIGMMLSPGIGPVAAILGILKAGKFYVPLDPGFARQRLKAIVDDAACAIIVTDDANIALVSALAHRAQLINIDALSPVPESDPGLAIRPGSNAYLLYTSGSTGQPKGVIQSHRNVMHQLTSYAKGLNIGPLDRLTLLHAYGFSAARLDIFGALLSGAGLFHFPVAEEGLGQLARWLQEEEITLLHWVPTAFRHWGDVLDASDRFPRMRLVVLGSEALSRRDIELHRRHFSPACVLVNRFGTTETGNICWSFIDTHTQLADGAVAVGCAIEDTEVLILDDAGIGVGPGQIGEIAVASEYLSPGYWGQPELSRSAFVVDAAAPGRRIYRTGDIGYKLPDGSVVHAGRKDLQIKIRGHRVEVAEIETALLAHPAIKEAAVAMGDEQAGDQRLLAYVVARGEPRPANAAIRAYLEPRLPAHMMPSGFVWMDKLPLTPSGKLDRLALSGAAGAGAARSTEFVAPRTPTEQTLSGIWSEVLAVDGIGVDDDFFDLGGHSLHAGRILGRVWERFGVEVQFRDLFDSPTIAGMAQIIDRERARSS